MRVRILRKSWFVLIIAMLLITPNTALAISTIRDLDVLSYAANGVGSPYVYGGGKWNPSNRSWGGADCSAFVSKSWQLPSYTAPTTNSHPYSTNDFYNKTYYWSALNTNRSTISKADALVRRNSSDGHIVIYRFGDAWGTPQVYEARGAAYGIVANARSFGSEYKPIRRNQMTITLGP